MVDPHILMKANNKQQHDDHDHDLPRYFGCEIYINILHGFLGHCPHCGVHSGLNMVI